MIPALEVQHAAWMSYWPKPEQLTLAIGIDDGEEAQWLARQCGQLVLVETQTAAESLREAPMRYEVETIASHLASKSVRRLIDKLPELSACYQLNLQFHRILLTRGCWLSIAPSQRERALRKLGNLLAPGGVLIIAQCQSDGCDALPPQLDELAPWARKFGLTLQPLMLDGSVILQLPDDGSGALARIRHIAVNDSKSSTYKLALLRTLVRIADAHPGAVCDRSDGRVAISLGLVALYWIRLFKRLLDADLQQNSNTGKGLGFVTQQGWQPLAQLKADDFAVGALFVGEQAVALQQLVADTIKTMQEGPVTFIYQGDKQNRLFTIERALRRKPSQSVLLDRAFFDSFGLFTLSEEMWNSLRSYGCWIEPLLVQQWIAQMKKYQRNIVANHSLDYYHEALIWLEREHDTARVRQRVDALTRDGHAVRSVWSGDPLRKYEVDHCLPFAYWPNNDLWNLLPASVQENGSKSDRVPSRPRLSKARAHILDWWQLAWSDERERQQFFIEAHLSLPNIPRHCRSHEEVFESMQDQILGVRQRLQVGEW